MERGERRDLLAGDGKHSPVSCQSLHGGKERRYISPLHSPGTLSLLHKVPLNLYTRIWFCTAQYVSHFYMFVSCYIQLAREDHQLEIHFTAGIRTGDTRPSN